MKKRHYQQRGVALSVEPEGRPGTASATAGGGRYQRKGQRDETAGGHAVPI